jgi:hypothetical protein
VPHCGAISRIAYTSHVTRAVRAVDPTTNLQLLLSLNYEGKSNNVFNCDEFEVLTAEAMKGLLGCNGV